MRIVPSQLNILQRQPKHNCFDRFVEYAQPD